MKKLIIISIITFTNCFLLNAQDIEQTRSIGINYYNDNDFTKSTKLLERVVFFKENPTSEDFILIAECKANLNDHKSAIYYYNLALNLGKSDILKTNIYLKIAHLLILNEQYNEAIEILLISEKIAYEYELERINFLLASSYFLIGDYSKSNLYFSRIVNDLNKLSEIFASLNKKYPKPSTAFWLSTVFPGVGQFYLGDVKDGLNSLLLNASLTTVFIYTAKESSFVTASFSIIPWLHRFISGGAKNAELSAIKKREDNNRLILKKIINLYYE